VNHMECYGVLTCGINPSKTTVIQPVPLNNRSAPVVWNDGVDLEVQIADEFVSVRVYKFQEKAAHELIGSVQISVPDVFSRMEGRLEKVKSLEHQSAKLLWTREDGSLEDAGKITFSVYATKPHTPLPPVLPGMDLRTVEEFDQSDPADALLNSWDFAS